MTDWVAGATDPVSTEEVKFVYDMESGNVLFYNTLHYVLNVHYNAVILNPSFSLALSRFLLTITTP